jgi:site-specific DNA-methyltransferase (adenine-specific)|nr:MAG TPA: adenine specific DNA methyltransferase [Caudoviricetes sp.]
MNVQEIKLKDIKPYGKNPRKNDDAVLYVAESIKQFGFKVPIVIDKNNVIVAGHTRYKAAKKLGFKSVPCIIADDLTDEQIKAFRLADNKVSEKAEWDLDLLDSEIEGIFDIDMTDFGFELESEELEAEEDEYQGTVPEDPVTRKGDMWKLGEHLLLCGDSTCITDVEKLMYEEKADMCFTDPPYGYEYQSNLRKKSKKFDVIENDDKILDFFPSIQLVCNGFIFICTTWKVLDKWIPLFKKYHDLTNMIIWNKGGGGIGDLKHTFSTDYEVILCTNNGKEITGKRIGSVWTIKKDSSSEYVHPTQKPIKLSEFAIRNTTERGDIVLDLFGGSGSTLIACEQMDRRCRMMEYDPAYCDVIVNRWEKFTGNKAELIREVERNE